MRIVTAREQVEMLSPWLREAMPTCIHDPDAPFGPPTHSKRQRQASDLDVGLDLDMDKHEWDWAKGRWVLKRNPDNPTIPPQPQPRFDYLREEREQQEQRMDERARQWREQYEKRNVREATPWYSKPGDPVYRIPTQDLRRHRQFNPSIETPEQMFHNNYKMLEDMQGPYMVRNRRPDGFSSGGSSEDSTEDGLVEAFESGAKLPPTEIYTNGPYAFLSDGNHRVNVADMLGHPDLDSYIYYDPHRSDDLFDDGFMEDNYDPGTSKVDPESELGRQIHKIVQNHPYKPVEGAPSTKHVFRRHPETGEWQRGKMNLASPPWIVDSDDYAHQMASEVPGFKHDGLGNYYEVDWGNGPEITHQRHLHARRGT